MRIDGAVSLCDRTQFTYPGRMLHRDYTAEDLAAILTRNRFEGAVAYACSGEPVAETDWLLALSGAPVLAVIAPAAATTPRDWDRWRAAGPRFAGVAGPPVALARELVARDLVCTATPAKALPLLDAAPELRLIVRAWPLAAATPEEWVRQLAPLRPLAHVLIQMDGVLDAAAARPAMQYVLESFGPRRLAFGSHWPAFMPAHTWKETLAGFTQALGAQPLPERLRIVGENLQEFLRLPSESHPLY
ncbi:MAG: hypothetical protein IT162_06575 [Bryobacterales bacterium]|nr:hypothetical protein [Bryobacterales bacterium]